MRCFRCDGEVSQALAAPSKERVACGGPSSLSADRRSSDPIMERNKASLCRHNWCIFRFGTSALVGSVERFRNLGQRRKTSTKASTKRKLPSPSAIATSATTQGFGSRRRQITQIRRARRQRSASKSRTRCPKLILHRAKTSHAIDAPHRVGASLRLRTGAWDRCENQAERATRPPRRSTAGRRQSVRSGRYSPSTPIA